MCSPRPSLADHVDKATIVEARPLPLQPTASRGLPQARHAHMLWSAGARVIESLEPSIDGWTLEPSGSIDLRWRTDLVDGTRAPPDGDGVFMTLVCACAANGAVIIGSSVVVARG